jgi:hypothetical protein
MPLRFINGHNKAAQQHGMSSTRIFWVWNAMIDRCRNPKNKGYHNYGGRGIRVCERWQIFENFLTDMGEPALGLTLERLNNDGHYESGNCEWATRRTQANNLRKNLTVSHDGRTLTLPEWARELALSYFALRQRYAIGERSPELFRPVVIRARPRKQFEARA